MKLYNLTVRRSDTLNAVVVCNLDVECLVWARGSALEVVRISDQDTLERVGEHNCGSAVRSLAVLSAASGDRLLVALCSGELQLLNWQGGRFVAEPCSIPCETHPRFAPEYLVADPQGRMAGALAIESRRTLLQLPEIEPLDASVSHTFCYAAQGVDRGHSSPAFVCLETFRLQQTKQLTLYELNLGLSHVLKLWSLPVPLDTNLIVDLGNDNLVLCADHAVMLVSGGKLVQELTVAGFITCATRITPSLVLLQCSDAQLIKLEVKTEENAISTSPVAMEETVSVFRHLVTLKSGFVFGAAELGEHQLLQITSLSPLTLAVASSVVSLAPITASLNTRQLTVASGRGRSKYLAWDKGLAAETLASTPLPFDPTKVFTAKKSSGDRHDGLILLATPSSTTVLGVSDEGAVEEVSAAGIAADVGTLLYTTFRRGAVQVHAYGLRYITSSGAVNSWQPNGAEILFVAHTETQLLVALSTKQLVYFEEALNEDELLEAQKRVNLPTVASAVCFAATMDLKSRGFYVGLQDETVRYYEVPSFKQSQLITVPYVSSSLVHTGPALYVGHHNGALSECRNGDVLSRALGSVPVLLTALDNAVIAVSSRTWYISPTSVVPVVTDARLKMVQKFVTEDLAGLVAISHSSLEVLDIALDTLRTDVVHDMAESSSTVINVLRVGPRQLLVGKHDLKWVDGASVHLPNIVTAVVAKLTGNPESIVAVATNDKILILDLTLETIHETSVQCTALAACQGYLLAAVGREVTVYGLGKRQLLWQHAVALPHTHCIRVLRTAHNQVFVGDSRASVTVLKFGEDALSVVAMDPIPRGVTRMIVLDPLTVCIGDQYGNISLLRIAPTTSDLEMIAHFTIDDAVVSLHKGTLTPLSGGSEAIIYVGIQGTVGVLTPFASSSELEQIEQLESLVRQHCDRSRTGSGSEPIKNVVNGDICELFSHQDVEVQTEIAELLDSSPQQIIGQLELIKGRVTL